MMVFGAPLMPCQRSGRPGRPGGLRPLPRALHQRANRIALRRPRIRIRILARQIGGFIESVFGHADLRERRRNTERAV
jgi:hypothetical protein